MSAVWVINLCFQLIVHNSLVLNYRMFINKWEVEVKVKMGA